MTSLPEFAWVVKRLAPESEVISLLSGQEDPHFIDASPGFVFKVAKADMLVVNGMELEVGWLPKVITLSGNKSIHMGQTGYCDASLKVKKIEMLQNYNRSMGDMHPQGNPHYTLSLPRMVEASEGIKDCLVKIGLAAPKLEKNFEKLKQELLALYGELKKNIKPATYYVFHREFNYLQADFGIDFKRSLEKIPGVLPSATYLAQMAIAAKKDQPKLVLASMTSPKKTLDKFKELSGIDYVKLQLHPRKEQNYLDFIRSIMQKFIN